MDDGVIAHARFRLSWGECDPAGIVYYASYFPWMERLHSEWWFDQGLRFDLMTERIGAHPVTRRTTCEYLAPARVLDPLLMTMRVGAIGRSSFTVTFDVENLLVPSEPVRVAASALDLVFIDPGGGSVPIPEAARTRLEARRVDGSSR